MPIPPDLASALRAQGAPESHLARIRDLTDLASREPTLLALYLVGSYARGNGDRVSDLDLVAIAAHGSAPTVLRAAHAVLSRHDVLNEFTGTHAAGGSFWKLVHLDFSSVEFHVFEPDTPFRLKHPFRVVWDPQRLVNRYVVDGEPIAHADFAAYEYGDAGLVWELVDCIKWLTRGRTGLAKHHLAKLAAAIKNQGATHGEGGRG